jgi:hypothetical protein
MHDLLPREVRDFSWRYDFNGNIFCEDVQIGHLQNVELAKFFVEVHNEIQGDM